jgi:hypothetical protein
VLEYAKAAIKGIHVDRAAFLGLGQWVGFGHKVVKGGQKLLK